MSQKKTFSSNEEPLQDMMKGIGRGETQLPEFQRGWVWDDIHIQSLLASVSLSYPIGAVMMLETGNPNVRFKPRLVEGASPEKLIEPERFILDGQQRLTSLFQALCMNEPVLTRDVRNKTIKRWYYIKMKEAVANGADREDAILSLHEDKRVRNFRGEVLEDYSSPEAEYAKDLFPFRHIFDCAEWRRAYNDYWKHASEKTKLFDDFERSVIKRFEQYVIPTIQLLKETPKEAVCQVFEKVNTGGVSLSVFELLTATFAADDFDLRADWKGEHNRRNEKIGKGRVDKMHEKKVLHGLAATDFLQTVTLLKTYAQKQEKPDTAIGCKRTDVLKLQLADYKQWADPATDGFIKVAKFLYQQKIFASKDLPYGAQLIPLAALFAVLGDKADNDSAREKLYRWYWCGVFGELYGGANETRFAKDLAEVVAWISGGGEPSTVVDSNFSPVRLYTLRTRNSAAYKGLYALLMRDGGLDFRTGEPIDVQAYFDDSIDIHHIFPREYCRKLLIPPKQYDSIVNKTPLSAKTNRVIGAKAPSEYLLKLRQSYKMDEHRQDEILSSHVVDVAAIKGDNFNAFFADRFETLLQRIEKVTGKPITRESVKQDAGEEPEENGSLETVADEDTST